MNVHDQLKDELNEALEHLKKQCGGSFSGSTIACDLDGTLIKSDLLVEGILREISYEPLRLIKAAPRIACPIVNRSNECPTIRGVNSKRFLDH